MTETKQDSGASVIKRWTRRELIVEALVKNHGFYGPENSDLTVGRIMAIMGITDAELKKRAFEIDEKI
jgi:hypothetical protein